MAHDPGPRSSPAAGAVTWIAPPPIFGPGVYARATADWSTLSGAPLRPGLSPKRARELEVGRRCAARALADAGSRDVFVGVGRAREPLWPSGFVGSITHSDRRACAAVAPTSVLRSLGVDFEPIFDDGAMRDAAPAAVSRAERRLAPAMPPRELATAVFSAKESLYKCLYPLVRVFFEFGDAEVEWITPSGAFRARLLRDLGGFTRGSAFEGRYAIEGGHVHTALELRI